MQRAKDVVIIGGGIAGLCAGLVLRRLGMPVRIIEQAAALTQVGAGIQISANGLRVLRWLGLEDELKAVSCLPPSFRAAHWATRESFHVKPFRKDHYQIHRADLLDVLKAALPPDAVTLGEKVTAMHQTADGVTLDTASGRRYDTDVVIAADGIHSTIREILFGADAPTFTGHVCWRFVVHIDKLDMSKVPNESITWHGPGGHVVWYPVSAGRRLNVVAYRESKDWVSESWNLRADKSEVHAAFEGWDPAIHLAIDAADFINKWAMFAREPLERWTVGRVALIGDSAHPMLPFLAQGAVMAIEDAYMLAALLARLPVDEALALYEAERRPRATRVQLAARSRTAMVDGGATGNKADAPKPEPSASAVDWIFDYDVIARTDAIQPKVTA